MLNKDSETLRQTLTRIVSSYVDSPMLIDELCHALSAHAPDGTVSSRRVEDLASSYASLCANNPTDKVGLDKAWRVLRDAIRALEASAPVAEIRARLNRFMAEPGKSCIYDHLDQADVLIRIDGDFESDADREQYVNALAARLQGSSPEARELLEAFPGCGDMRGMEGWCAQVRAFLRTEGTKAPVTVADERGRFEARFAHLKKYPDITPETWNYMWFAWEARANEAIQAPAATAAPDTLVGAVTALIAVVESEQRQSLHDFAADQIAAVQASLVALPPAPEPWPGYHDDIAAAIGELSQAMGSPTMIARRPASLLSATVRAAAERIKAEASAPGESYNDLFNALQRIDTAAVALPGFEVRHEGGLDAVVKNIVEAIERCSAKAEPDTFEQERQLNEVMELVDSLADESATKAYHGELRCRRKPHELRALILAKLTVAYVPGQHQESGKG